MESPKATQNIRTGSVVSMSPVLVKPSRPERFPSWKTQTNAPNIAVRLRALSTTAWSGMSTLPVSRKTRSSVTTTMIASAQGSLSAMASLESTRTAAVPVTETSREDADGTALRSRTSCWVASPTASPSGSTL